MIRFGWRSFRIPIVNKSIFAFQDFLSTKSLYFNYQNQYLFIFIL